VAHGLAYAIPAPISDPIALGALAAWLVERRSPALAARFTLAAAAGLVAGESLVGVAASFFGMAAG
jgi:uncharacterized oligopeptide transporter (OPT) family protein